MLKKSLILLLLIIIILAISQRKMLIRLYDGTRHYFVAKAHLKYYQLQNGKIIEDITERLSLDESIPLGLRQPLINGERKIIIFKYPSDGLKVAGYLSYIPANEHPLIVFLRGGNGTFGIMRPNNPFSYFDGYNVIGTLYRGTIYDGLDEFGGKDINDVENLLKFLPELEKFTQLNFKPPFAMMGVSRGAMQMFDSLSLSSYVKERVNKAISISGNVDLTITAKLRPEMHYDFEKRFKEQNEDENLNAWINRRNPVSLAHGLSPFLQVLMLYGLKDNRVALSEQESMLHALLENNISAKLVTFPLADHGFNGQIDQLKKTVLQFLNQIENE